ncbi:hypothetical protein IHE45_12G016200 [Dioscorea alata]|uniref:Uncharacterized protein n=2 Tax=Dioscorea alata TaxID=55571 RepID=A0ACB7V0V1_DIOAL|nr:hypothetical protein IHE45_12G016100 [Dioscorea alata]KAH7666742.1 hypothetical protein IHE45_12G016200 [Dioscorea alata]
MEIHMFSFDSLSAIWLSMFLVLLRFLKIGAFPELVLGMKKIKAMVCEFNQ